MKIKLLAGLCLLSASLISCQAAPTTQYLTPIVTGQVLDKYTNQPIPKANILYTGNTYTQTDEDGYFRLPSITTNDEYTADSAELSEMDISINKESYKGKTYSSFGIQRIKIAKVTEVPEYIHIGKVYLEPLPNNVKVENSYKYEEYIEDMSYCQSNESQKEVNCIPLPDGVDHEVV